MTNIDQTTGLPELPAGYVWKIIQHTWSEDLFPGSSLGKKLKVELWRDNIYSYLPAEEGVLAYANNESIRKAANKILRRFNRELAKRKKRDYLKAFTGTYPPKKLED